MRIYLSLALALWLTPGFAWEKTAPVRLSSANMSETIGGMSVTNFSQPANDNAVLDQDNPLFSFTVQNPNAVPHDVTISDGTKYQGQKVVTAVNGGTQTVKIRAVRWPLIGPQTATVMHKQQGASQWTNADQKFRRTGLRVNSALKVAGVKFYHLQETGGANPTTLNPMWPITITDNTDENYAWQTTASMDAIMNQCPVAKRWNFRFAGSHTLTVPTGCTNPRWFLSVLGFQLAPGTVCPNFFTIVGNLIEEEAAESEFDPDDYLNVVIVNSHGIWDGSTYRTQGGYSAPGHPFVVVADNVSSVEKFASVVAHEATHRQFGGTFCHINQNPETDTLCGLVRDVFGQNEFDPNHDCGDMPWNTTNLMCSSSGRQLTAAQCDRLSTATTFLRDLR